MTSLENRPSTALLVIDMQQGVVANAYQRDRVIANIQTLVAKARAQDVPVLWVQHSDEEMPIGSDGWAYVPELERRETEPLVGLPVSPEQSIAYTNMYWSWAAAPGRAGNVTSAEETEFSTV